MVDLTGAIALLVDGGDLHLQHEADRRAARRGQRPRHRLGDVVAQAKQPGLGGNQFRLQLGAPGRMGEVAGGDHADALAAGPGREMLQIEVAAGRPRIFGMNVQVGMEAHVIPTCLRREACEARGAKRDSGGEASELPSAGPFFCGVGATGRYWAPIWHLPKAWAVDITVLSPSPRAPVCPLGGRRCPICCQIVSDGLLPRPFSAAH